MQAILGFILIILGLKVIIIKKFSARGAYVDFTNPYLYWSLGILLFGVGFSFLINSFKSTKIKITEYSKCPQCKTAYDYQKLNKGMCPKCHIPTIDMDEYFKQFPDELKDEKEPNETKR